MNLVSDLLKKNNVQMSLAVYPWPDTIFYDKTENINYKMWKEFCHLRCKNFYNLNKIFFNKLKTTSKNKVITDYFIEGDFHFNKEGSKIVADEFLKQYSNNKP